jgi:hypothetical protein
VELGDRGDRCRHGIVGRCAVCEADELRGALEELVEAAALVDDDPLNERSRHLARRKIVRAREVLGETTGKTTVMAAVEPEP